MQYVGTGWRHQGDFQPFYRQRITAQDTGYRSGAAEGSGLPARYAVYFGEQRRFLLDCVILKMKALRAIETSGTIHQPARHNIAADLSP